MNSMDYLWNVYGNVKKVMSDFNNLMFHNNNNYEKTDTLLSYIEPLELFLRTLLIIDGIISVFTHHCAIFNIWFRINGWLQTKKNNS